MSPTEARTSRHPDSGVITRDVTEAGRSRPQGVRDVWRLVHLLWCGACLAILGLLIGVRWLRYSSSSAAPPVDHVVRELMVFDAQAFLWPWAYSRAQAGTILLAVLVAVVGLHRRLLRHLVEARRGVAVEPLATGLLVGAMVWFNYLFDLNPTIGGGSLVSLALFTAITSPLCPA